MIAKVTPGVPVLIGGTDVVLRGGARTDKDYLKLLDTRPAIGTVLNQGDYENFKKSLTSIALRKGYFDSEFTKAQLGIALGLHKAFWDIDYNSGERYRFGHVTFEGSQIRDEYLQNLVPFKEGDEYESKDLAELNRRLSATGWFNSVVVAPQFDKARETKVLPLTGVVSPRTEKYHRNRGRLLYGRGTARESDVEKAVDELLWSQSDHQYQYFRAGTDPRLQL